ncbi:MAG: hypothetical protein ACR2IJ_08695 [Fluviibacter sp.]
MNKLEKMYRLLQNTFPDKLDEAVLETLGSSVITQFDIVLLRLVTVSDMGRDLNKQERSFIKAYAKGYEDAMSQVGHAAK